VEVVDQDGRQVRFYSDLVRGRRVAINFVFTTCTTICPPMGANFERLQALLGARAGADVRLLSISVDPLTDTPERLKAWGARFHAGPGWTLLTGRKEELDRLLKAMGIFTADPASHAPILLLGDDRTGRWTRAYGLAPPAKIVQLLDGLSAAAAPAAATAPTAPAATTSPVVPAATTEPAPAPATSASPSAPAEQRQESAAHHYFTDVELIDQDGRPQRLYSDLLAGKTVVVDSFFSSCTGSCPAVAATLARIQAALGDRLGRDVVLLSLSVDPQTDTPARLKEYAARLGARPGWYFLTGSKQNVDLALQKLGQYSERKEDHTNLLIVGNERTGLWKKVFGLAKPEEILAIVQGVLDDRGAPGNGG
jgi:cytochrome oxidase Cu insertion factor (SCO1/SenC/PrrC family)